MDKSAIEEFVRSIIEIGFNSNDIAEKSGIAWAVGEINSANEKDMESTLKTVRDHLFHHKGPLYDSLDQREDMDTLRAKCYQNSKQAINYCIKLRRGELT